MNARSTTAVAACLMVAMSLGACKHSGLAPGKTAAQAAAVNVQLSIEYMKLGKLADSRDFIERAMKQDPDNANVQLTAGLVYERLKDMSKAQKAYSTAARIGVRDPNIQNNYAGFLCRTGKSVQGEKLFIEVANNPVYQTPEVALVNAGVCVRSNGRCGGCGEILQARLGDSPQYARGAIAAR